MQECSADAIGSGVPVGVGLNSYAGIEPWRVIFQVNAHKIGIDGMRNIGRDHEAICVHLGEAIHATAVFGEGFTDALQGAWEKVAMGALPKERANLLIVKASDYFDGAGVGFFKAGSNQCFDSGEGAELVVYATRKDELFVQAAELGRLSVEKLQLPIYDAAIW